MKTALSILTITLLFWQFSDVHSTTVSQCSDISLLPDSVEIENCEQEPCILHINSTTTMTMKFKSPWKLEHIAPKATAAVLGLTISYPLDQDDACAGIVNTKCPVEEGEEVEYTYEMFILPIFPKISLDLEFSLVDEDQNDGDGAFECFKVKLQLE